jgi:gas vesicle protein GvpL/GvpF
VTGEGTAVWVYAVTPEVDLDLPGAIGVAHRPVRTVKGADLAAIVSSVDLAEYGEKPLHDKLEDLATLDPIARAHHDIVTAAWGRAPVVPMRLATVYRDDARVAAMLAERHADLLTALGRLVGHAEWGVKAYATTSTSGPPAEGPASTGGSKRPGTDYLRRRRVEMTSAEQSRRAALAASDSVHEQLADVADAARRHVPQDRQLTGVADPMLLNGAYLVADERTGDFVRAVRALNEQQTAVRLELTGPWPGYSFAGDDEAGARR